VFGDLVMTALDRLRAGAGRTRGRPGVLARWAALDDDPPLLCGCCEAASA
jgi:hypothetical protein